MSGTTANAKPDWDSVIRRAIEAEVEDAIESELRQAARRIERYLPEIVAKVAFKVASRFDIARDQQRLVITIEQKDVK